MMEPRKLRKIESDLLRQEDHLKRALSQSGTLLIIASIPAALSCVALVLFGISSFGTQDPLGWFAMRLNDALQVFREASPVSVLFTLLFFAWWQECRLKLRHIETIKKIIVIERSQQGCSTVSSEGAPSEEP